MRLPFSKWDVNMNEDYTYFSEVYRTIDDTFDYLGNLKDYFDFMQK